MAAANVVALLDQRGLIGDFQKDMELEGLALGHAESSSPNHILFMALRKAGSVAGNGDASPKTASIPHSGHNAVNGSADFP